MKKTIIYTFAIMLAVFSANAQNDNLDETGMPIKPGTVKKITQVQSATVVINPNLDATGMPKSNNTKKPVIALNEKSYPAVDNGDGTGTIIGEQPVFNKTVQTQNTVATSDYRSKGDIPVDYTNGVKENYTRKSSVDVPADYSNGVKENYKRTDNVKEENQSTYSGTATNVQTIAEADKNLSDAELNKKYPNRNISKNMIAPSTGTNSSVSDADLKNQTPVTNTNTFQPAKTQPANQVSDR